MDNLRIDYVSGLFCTTVQFQNYPYRVFKAIVATGASVTAIPSTIFSGLPVEYEKIVEDKLANYPSLNISNANGEGSRNFPAILRNMRIGAKNMEELHCIVFDSKSEIILLGMDFIMAFEGQHAAYSGLVLSKFDNKSYRSKRASFYGGMNPVELSISQPTVDLLNVSDLMR